MSTSNETIEQLAQREYKYGFETTVEADTFEPGLDEDVVRRLSAIKQEPEWLLEFRLTSFRAWQKMTEPVWHTLKIKPTDYQALSYYSAPKKQVLLNSMDEVDPEVRATFEKLGIPLEEQKLLAGVAVDAVFDSVSVATTFREKLGELGIIFCSFSEAVKAHPDLVKQYLGSVVPYTDNFYATLNSAVFSDGSFVYIPKGVRCPMELSTYFRINARNTGQFERTLIVADEGSHVSYLEGCTAPMRDENQLHAAVVELVSLEGATIKYSTIQNWYPGDKDGKGGIYNFVTKRGLAHTNAKITWTQVETGSAITWKYPSCILQGDNSVGEFYSVATTNNWQQADTGTKMIHLGKNTRSTIVSKGISAGHGQNTYRGAVKIGKKAAGARNYSQCDSLLIGDQCGAHTFPYLEIKNTSSMVEHEASTSKIGEDQIFYCRQRGISSEDAVNMIVSGFCKEVFRELPMEFAVEAQKLLSISLEGSVGSRTLRELRSSKFELRSCTDDTEATDSQGSARARGGQRHSQGPGPDRRARPGARHHGAERLGQEHAGPRIGRSSGLRGHRRLGHL
jgi:Fe-S cluster assembly protein SufB